MDRIYLDWAATAAPAPEIARAAAEISTKNFGNPSSAHREGRAAERLLGEARERFAGAIGVPPRTVYFTSGGTESNNMVLSSLLSAKGELVVSGIEHSSVYEPSLSLQKAGIRVRWIEAESDGRIDPEKLKAALSPETLMVAVMHVNNETGAIQPIDQIARLIREYERTSGSGRRIHFHCDGVQALGKIATMYGETDVDSVSFSAHKIGGLRGAGALYLRRPIPVVFRGGGQERDVRPGTENLPAIWAMAEAAEQANRTLSEHSSHASHLKSLLVDGVRRIEGSRIVPGAAATDPGHFSPFILSVAFPPLPGEVLVRVLDDAGCAVSTGSACSSKGRKDRRVLANMGVDEETARSAIRISTGYSSSENEIATFLEKLPKEVLTWSAPLRT